MTYFTSLHRYVTKTESYAKVQHKTGSLKPQYSLTTEPSKLAHLT